MAEAIISRLLEKNLYGGDSIIIGEPLAERRQWWQNSYKVAVTEDNQRVLAESEIILLAIKPQNLKEVVASIRLEDTTNRPLVVSILAGVSLKKLGESFPGLPLVRVMPNTPAVVGEAMTAITANELVSPLQLQQVRAMFEAIGEVVEIPEYLMDAVTGLSGSGPAFVAIMIEALSDGGVAAGLPRQMALDLAIQTVLGTATLLKLKKLHPAILKDQVSSPGGTTIAGVMELENRGFRGAVASAVMAAYKKARDGF